MFMNLSNEHLISITLNWSFRIGPTSGWLHMRILHHKKNRLVFKTQLWINISFLHGLQDRLIVNHVPTEMHQLKSLSIPLIDMSVLDVQPHQMVEHHNSFSLLPVLITRFLNFWFLYCISIVFNNVY